MIKLCPKCESLAHYNSYFQAYICSSPSCSWMEKIETTKHVEEVINNG